MNGPHEPPFVLVSAADARQVSALRAALSLAGAHVASATSVSVALEAVTFHLPNVIVVDVCMEDGHGWEVAHAAARAGHVPLVVIDSGADQTTRMAAFAAGADEVVIPPIDAAELATRIVALAARVRGSETHPPRYRHRGLVLDVGARTVHVAGRAVGLTAQQFGILHALLEARGATLPRARLLAHIEALDDEPPSERAIDLHVARLRRRLGDDPMRPRFVEAVYGVGYRLAIEQPTGSGLDESAETVLAAFPDPVLVIDGKRRIRFANDALCRLLTRARADILGRRCDDILDCHDQCAPPPPGPRCLALSVRSGETTLRDVPIRVRAGEEWLEVAYTIATVPGDDLLTILIRPR